MASSYTIHAFNDYFETIAELGILGLIIYVIFWCSILKTAYDIFLRFSRLSIDKNKEDKNQINQNKCNLINLVSGYKKTVFQNTPNELRVSNGNDYILIGFVGSILCFMVMSLFHYPGKIIPVFLTYNVCLACMISENQVKKHVLNIHTNKISHIVLTITSSIGLVVCLVLIPTYLRRYKAVNDWHCADRLKQIKYTNDSIQLYDKLYPKLKWNGRFLRYYGELLIESGEDKYAVDILEKAKRLWPSPQLFENLGVAYVNYSATADFQQDITNELHPHKSPLKGGVNPPNPQVKGEAWRMPGGVVCRVMNV